MKRIYIPKKVRVKVHEKYNHRCAYCGCDIEYKDMQVDHIIPHRNYSRMHSGMIHDGQLITDYGIDDIENLNPTCRVCNGWKSVWSVEEFRREIQLQIERLQRNSSGFRIALKYGLIKETNTVIKFYFEYKSNELCLKCGKPWERCGMCRSGVDHQSCVEDCICYECKQDMWAMDK